MCEEIVVNMNDLWWNIIWKYKFPMKSRIFMWISLNDRIMTWDLCQKRGLEGPDRCPLCKDEEESMMHLLMNYGFSKNIWNE
jgi:hypothetical protein